MAVEVASAIGGEIVGCDALQVYRGLDAATAKPGAGARERIRHWLIDVADPRSDYSAAEYVREADAAIAAIRTSGRVPVIVGGTGMYLRALLKGIVPAPARDEGTRARLRALVDRFGAVRLHRLLTSLDPVSAERIAPADAQRIVRALELAFDPEETWSARLAREGTWSRPGERYAALKIGIDLDRSALSDRLSGRVDRFFAAGLPGEVRRLLDAGVPETANALKGIGYRQVLRALQDGVDPDAVREAVSIATRQYAKRQRTWFRKEPGLIWLDAGIGVERLKARIVESWTAFATPGPAAAPC